MTPSRQINVILIILASVLIIPDFFAIFLPNAPLPALLYNATNDQTYSAILLFLVPITLFGSFLALVFSIFTIGLSYRDVKSSSANTVSHVFLIISLVIGALSCYFIYEFLQ